MDFRASPKMSARQGNLRIRGRRLCTQPNMIFSVLIDGRRRLRSASCGGPNQRIAEISHTSGAIFFIGNYRITRGKWPA
jgi:hypothetical protein